MVACLVMPCPSPCRWPPTDSYHLEEERAKRCISVLFSRVPRANVLQLQCCYPCSDVACQPTDTSPAPATEAMPIVPRPSRCPLALLPSATLMSFSSSHIQASSGSRNVGLPAPMQSPAHGPCSQLHPKAKSEAGSFCLWSSCHRGTHPAALKLEFFLFSC